VLPQEIVQGLVPEANGATPAGGLPEPVLPQFPGLFLVFAGGVGPNALRRQLPQVLVFVVVRRVDPRHLAKM